MSNKIEIKSYDGLLPDDVLIEVEALAEQYNIGEPYNRDADMTYTWVEGGKIVAVVAFQRVLFSDGRTIPRLGHVIFDKEHDSHAKAKASYAFMMMIEQQIIEYGYEQMWAYIYKTRKVMHNLAIRFGFQQYDEDTKGVFVIKNITKRRK